MATDHEVKDSKRPETETSNGDRDSEGTPPDDKFEGLYERHIGRLIAAAVDDFGVPEESAVVLAHEVMLSFPSRVAA